MSNGDDEDPLIDTVLKALRQETYRLPLSEEILHLIRLLAARREAQQLCQGKDTST